MSGKAYLGTSPEAACIGKEAFDSPALANKAARRAKGRIAYRCPHCGLYHVGHSGTKPKIRRRFDLKRGPC